MVTPVEYEDFLHMVEDKLKEYSPAQRQQFLHGLAEVYCFHCGYEQPITGRCDCSRDN